MTDNPDDVCTRLPTRTAPRIAGIPEGSGTIRYFIMIETQVIFCVYSFPKALAFWFVCHYIFNLQYCKQAKEVAMFFQEYVFGLTEKSKNKSATYLSVCSDICKYVVEDM